MRRVPRIPALAALTFAASVSACGPDTTGRAAQPPAADVRAVTDMTGTVVRLPRTLTRVATISDGFVESVMTRLGTVRTLVVLGSTAQQLAWSYRFPDAAGREWSVGGGMGTMRALHPWLAGLPCASPPSGEAVSIETIVAASPQVVIMRVGDCTIGTSPDTVRSVTALLHAVGVPVVTLRSPSDFRHRSLDTLREEILLLGRVFGEERQARALVEELAAVESSITKRLAGLDGVRRPTALYLGLASGARESGGAAYVWGADTTESWMLETLAGGRNAYRGTGARVLLNAEQLLALDPDVIFLPTSAGFHPPRELAEAPYFRNLQRLRAVRSGRVYPMPWTPLNCARRLEYPIDLMIMAKALHPDRFGDLVVHEWVLGFYRQLYGVTDEQGRQLRQAQWLDWMAERGF